MSSIAHPFSSGKENVQKPTDEKKHFVISTMK